MTIELYELVVVLSLIYIVYNEIRHIFLIKQIEKSIDLVYKTLDVVDRYSRNEPVEYFDYYEDEAVEDEE